MKRHPLPKMTELEVRSAISHYHNTGDMSERLYDNINNIIYASIHRNFNARGLSNLHVDDVCSHIWILILSGNTISKYLQEEYNWSTIIHHLTLKATWSYLPSLITSVRVPAHALTVANEFKKQSAKGVTRDEFMKNIAGGKYSNIPSLSEDVVNASIDAIKLQPIYAVTNSDFDEDPINCHEDPVDLEVDLIKRDYENKISVRVKGLSNKKHYGVIADRLVLPVLFRKDHDPATKISDVVGIGVNRMYQIKKDVVNLISEDSVSRNLLSEYLEFRG